MSWIISKHQNTKQRSTKQQHKTDSKKYVQKEEFYKLTKKGKYLRILNNADAALDENTNGKVVIAKKYVDIISIL